jgi:hypothetical protein
MMAALTKKDFTSPTPSNSTLLFDVKFSATEEARSNKETI